MSNEFFNISKEVANGYIQNIIFIDDDIYPKEGETLHDLNPEEVTKFFLEKEKVCALYNPKSEVEFERLVPVSKKADIVVLDWNIDVQNTDNDGDSDEEEDVEIDDPRGIHSMELINNTLFEDANPIGLKLIVIYTGELDLANIQNRIYNSISSIDNDVKKEGDFNVIGSSYKIAIIAKETTSKKYTPEELKERIIPYSGLPDFVINEFTSLTNGLLSNFALKSLTEIRKNSNMLLSLFSKELDPAYLSHQALIPNREDANELLVELIKDAIGGILTYNKVNKYIDDTLIDNWLNDFIAEEDKPVLNRKGKKLNPSKNYHRDLKLLKGILLSGEINVGKKFHNLFKSDISDKKTREEYFEYRLRNATSMFLNNSQAGNECNINIDFAKLAHHKSLYKPNGIEPKLTLGTVVKSNKYADKYYLCIQQRCDSVRLSDKERKFLFLPLNVGSNGKFQLTTKNGKKLILDKKSFSLRTIKFKGDKEEGIVKGLLQDDGTFIFKQIYQGDEDEQFIWEFDLKDLHAQRIVDEYSSLLSRIGVDEYEWLRRNYQN